MHRSQFTSSNVNFLGQVFHSDEDTLKCYGSLAKLARHIQEPIMITGSVAVSWHLVESDKLIQKRKFNDLDVVVEGLHNLHPSLNNDFLIRHFHPNRGQGKILIMLVDEEYRTRIDVFTPASARLTKRMTDCSIGEIRCTVVSAEDLLAKLLGSIYHITNNELIEPKYLESFNLLSSVVDMKKIREIWQEYRKESQPLDFEEALEAIHRSTTLNPSLLQRNSYSQDLDEVCPWCCQSESFPLAPLSRIFEILGYV